MKMKQLGAALVFMVLLGSLLAAPALALDDGVYTATVLTAYENPDTGEVDDGGSANAALGEGMCRSVTGKTALVEVDGSDIWITLRMLLQSDCKNVALAARTGYNSYADLKYTIMAEDGGKDSIDYRFKVSEAGVTLRGTMYVTPMGRDVLWYLYLDTGTLEPGSGDFIVSIDPSKQAELTEPAPALETTTEAATEPIIAPTTKSVTEAATEPANGSTAPTEAPPPSELGSAPTGAAEEPTEPTEPEANDDAPVSATAPKPSSVEGIQDGAAPTPPAQKPEEAVGGSGNGGMALLLIAAIAVSGAAMVLIRRKRK